MQFKKGDIICSDSFRCGLLMFVEDSEKKRWYPSEDDTFYYSCTSLLNPKQTWCAYEDYNFRIATDDDITKGLASYIKALEVISSDVTLDISDKCITLDDGHESFIMLTPQEAIQLRNVINTYVGE